MDIYTLAGLAGFVVYVMAYALLQFGVFSGHSVAYTVSNTVAAALVLVSLIAEFNLAAALIQVTWIAIGLVGMINRWVHTETAHVHRQPTLRIAEQPTSRLASRFS